MYYYGSSGAVYEIGSPGHIDPKHIVWITVYRNHVYMQASTTSYTTAAPEYWSTYGYTTETPPARAWLYRAFYFRNGNYYSESFSWQYWNIPTTTDWKPSPWIGYWCWYRVDSQYGNVTGYYSYISKYRYYGYKVYNEIYQYTAAIEYTTLQYRYNELD